MLLLKLTASLSIDLTIICLFLGIYSVFFCFDFWLSLLTINRVAAPDLWIGKKIGTG